MNDKNTARTWTMIYPRAGIPDYDFFGTAMEAVADFKRRTGRNIKSWRVVQDDGWSIRVTWPDNSISTVFSE